MTEKDIRAAYCKIRTIDQTISDDVLDFMKDSAIKSLNESDELTNKSFLFCLSKAMQLAYTAGAISNGKYLQEDFEKYQLEMLVEFNKKN